MEEGSETDSTGSASVGAEPTPTNAGGCSEELSCESVDVEDVW